MVDSSLIYSDLPSISMFLEASRLNVCAEKPRSGTFRLTYLNCLLVSKRDLSQGSLSLIVLNIVQWIALYDTNVCFHPLPSSRGIFSLITDKSYSIQLVTIFNGKEFRIVILRLCREFCVNSGLPLKSHKIIEMSLNPYDSQHCYYITNFVGKHTHECWENYPASIIL